MKKIKWLMTSPENAKLNFVEFQYFNQRMFVVPVKFNFDI